jgi:hypothetical protein
VSATQAVKALLPLPSREREGTLVLQVHQLTSFLTQELYRSDPPLNNG